MSLASENNILKLAAHTQVVYPTEESNNLFEERQIRN
jgi:hypothetical protein